MMQTTEDLCGMSYGPMAVYSKDARVKRVSSESRFGNLLLEVLNNTIFSFLCVPHSNSAAKEIATQSSCVH